MSSSIILFTKESVENLVTKVNVVQENFDLLLNQLFSKDEIEFFDHHLESLAPIVPQSFSSELLFDDFTPQENIEDLQRIFFDSCKGLVLIEKVPFFENNPFQVSYLLVLAEHFDEFLIDRGGNTNLIFKKEFEVFLKKFKTLDQLTFKRFSPPNRALTSIPVDPIDFLIADVYKEITRLGSSYVPIHELGEKHQNLLKIMQKNKFSNAILLKESGMSPKDFDDGLEKLKFWLKKI